MLVVMLMIIGCKAVSVQSPTSVELKFLDEYILDDDIYIDSTLVGGLSGLDAHKDRYLLVCDDSKNPRYYEASIAIHDGEIQDISFEKVHLIQDSIRFLDLEGLQYDAQNDAVIISSEGSMNLGKDPALLAVKNDLIIRQYIIPENYLAKQKKARNNGVFEGLAKESGGQGYWLAAEIPLNTDGPEPSLERTQSPVRITLINNETAQPNDQFSYVLEPVAKPPKGNFMVNGLTDLIALDKNRFIVLERSFSSGLGKLGNTVRLYLADKSAATNTIAMDSLWQKTYIPAKKKLLLDFENYRDKLTDGIIDNMEGICFGPVLANGNRSLILVSDNNFNVLGKQLNQFILLELKE